MTKPDFLAVSGWLEGLTPLNYHRVMKLIEKLIKENQELTHIVNATKGEPAQQGLGDPGVSSPPESPWLEKLRKMKEAEDAQRKQSPFSKRCPSWEIGPRNPFEIPLQRRFGK